MSTRPIDSNFGNGRRIEANGILGVFDNAAETLGLEPFHSDTLTETRRILDLVDDVNRAAWELKNTNHYKELADKLVAGEVTASKAVEAVTRAEQDANTSQGMHTPASKLAVNLKSAARAQVGTLDEKVVLDWFRPALDQATADAHHWCNIVDDIDGVEPHRDPPGLRSNQHQWEPRRVSLRRDKQLARAWADLDSALDTVYLIADYVHQLRTYEIISRPKTDTRDTIWSQVWETIPEGSFNSDTRPGRTREFFRCHRRQHSIGLPTATELDRNSGELENDDSQDAMLAARDVMANAGYKSIFPAPAR